MSFLRKHLKSGELFSQPIQLYLLFFTELWERFGFYTVQTIIILYMTKALAMSDSRADILYATFSSLLYITPVIGGYIADRYIGFQRAIIFGGVLFIIGYLLTAVPQENIFFIGLSIIICANGFFKPNVSSIVGELYEQNDPRRDGGFTIFYMGINVGSLIPPIIAGYIVTNYGWSYGFILAAIGMLFGQLIFMRGRKYLRGIGEHANQRNAQKNPPALFYLTLFAGVCLAIILFNIAFKFSDITNFVVEAAAVLILLVTFFFIFREPVLQRRRMFACVVLIIISIGFWSLYNQTFTSLMLFADRNMQHHLFGLPLDAEFTQFFNPFFIIALSPMLSALWIKLDNYNLNPSVQMKFSFGVLFMSLGFILLAFGAKYFGSDGVTSPWWLIGSYFLQTVGELLLSPVGLAMITVLCPKHLVGMMMGVWFFSQAAAFAIGGSLAQIAAVPSNVSVTSSLQIYAHAFGIYGSISLVIAVISFMLVPFLNKLIRIENMLRD